MSLGTSGTDVTARELKLFTENDSDIYRQQTTSIIRNLRTKQAKGTYDHDLAVKLFMYLAETGARKYAREHGGGEHEWHSMFPTAARRRAAEEWRDEFEEESRLGNYDNETFLPKKYLREIAEKKSARASGRSEGARASRSTAYQSGAEDGATWCQFGRPSRSVLERLLKRDESVQTPSQDLVSNYDNKSPESIAKKLGVGVRSLKFGNRSYAEACEQYDEGFYASCEKELGEIVSGVDEGSELAQRVASNLTEDEVEKIVLLGRDPPGRRRGPEFKKSYLRRMTSILDAMRGN